MINHYIDAPQAPAERRSHRRKFIAAGAFLLAGILGVRGCSAGQDDSTHERAEIIFDLLEDDIKEIQQKYEAREEIIEDDLGFTNFAYWPYSLLESGGEGRAILDRSIIGCDSNMTAAIKANEYGEVTDVYDYRLSVHDANGERTTYHFETGDELLAVAPGTEIC